MPKLSTYPTATLAQGDQLPIVDDPGGTPSTKLITASHALVNIQTGAGFDTPTQSGTPPTYAPTASEMAAQFGKILIINQSVTNYITIPDGLPDNFRFRVYQAGSGSTVIQGNGTSSVTGVTSSGSILTATGASKSLLEVHSYGTDTYVVTGSNLAVPPFANSYSVEMAANGSYINIPQLETSLNSSTALTIAMWFKLDTTNTYNHFIGRPGYFGYKANISQFEISWNTLSGTHNAWSINGRDGNWHLLVLTQDSSNFSAHLDGTSSDTGETESWACTAGPSNLASQLRFGGDGSSDYHRGHMDEIGIWNSVLTDAEISALYNSGTPISFGADSGDYSSSSNLLHWWRGGDDDGGSGTNMTDVIGGSSYDATLTGTAAFAADVA